MSEPRPDPEHDPILDSLGGLRDAPGEPPPAFMALVRRRRRRAVAVRVGGTIISGAVIALIGLAISLPLLRGAAPPRRPVVHAPDAPTRRSVVPTAASVRWFIEDPALLDVPLPAGAPSSPVRAGDRADSPAGRSLLMLN
jgi:hypothetical protein